MGVRNRPRYKKWWGESTAAICLRCGERWESVFEIFRLKACPGCGHRYSQSKAWDAAHPSIEEL